MQISGTLSPRKRRYERLGMTKISYDSRSRAPPQVSTSQLTQPDLEPPFFLGWASSGGT